MQSYSNCLQSAVLFYVSCLTQPCRRVAKQAVVSQCLEVMFALYSNSCLAQMPKWFVSETSSSCLLWLKLIEPLRLGCLQTVKTVKRAICEITWKHEGHFHVFLGLAGKKPFPWSDLYTAGPCDLFVLLISRAANCALICRAWASQGNALVGKDTWTVKFMQTAFEIHAVLTNTGSHFELNYRSGNMNAAIQVFCTTAILNRLVTETVVVCVKRKCWKVIVCWNLEQ